MATMKMVQRAAWEAALRMANAIYNIKQAKEVRRSEIEQLGAAQAEFDRHRNAQVESQDGRGGEELQISLIILGEFEDCKGATMRKAHAAAIKLLAAGWFRAAAVADEWRGPIPETQGKKPLVLYFQTDEDRQEFADLVHAIKPKMIARAL